MTPEAGHFLRKARQCLSNANTILSVSIPDVAAREAYLAGYHAAEAFIFELAGKTLKTHKGVRSEFARLTRTDAILREFTSFLARAYELKSIADYGIDPDVHVSLNDAKDAYGIASRFVAAVADKLSTPV